MVHPQDAWCESLDDILSFLKAGDILTHCFHGHGCGILDERGGIRKPVYAARDRGVVFDVGHGIGSFNWQVAEKACEHDFFPDTVSSDLHVYGIDGPVFDLVTTMSKFLYLGLSLEDVLAKTTAGPAKILGIPDRIGTLVPGAEADAVVLDIRTGSFDYWDAHEKKRTGHLKIGVESVISKGRIYN